MVRCPKGTISQVKANLARTRPALSNVDTSFFSWAYDPNKEKEGETLAPELEESELESIKPEKRYPLSAQEELIFFFVNNFLDILLESWEGKSCTRQKLALYQPTVEMESEEYGEDLGPCESSIVSSTADFLKDLYLKRSVNLSKVKKDSNSSECEYLNEEDFDSSESGVPKKPADIDEDVRFVFKNGVWYKGRVSRRLMDGEGVYFWEDGSCYQGEFERGFMTGLGRLEFPDLSVYEGGVYKAFRHGEGMFCFSDSKVMYSGQWWLGKKHGHGLIVYNDPSLGHNFYRGQWQDGFKEGFGFRQYPSGAKYVGFWSNGKRHGRGVMFWSNNDIYRGEWREGTMHGYGEYTWDGFINKSLSYPGCNTYRGFWAHGKRNGRGLFELKTGSVIETSWVDNMKEGFGAVICQNGAVIASENLFAKDKPASFSLSKNSAENSMKDELSKFLSNKRKERPQTLPKNLEVLNVISIPIHSPVHTLDLESHTYKLFEQKRDRIVQNLQNAQLDEIDKGCSDSDSELNVTLTDAHLSLLYKCKAQEDKYLRHSIISYMSSLRACYDYYAELACEKPPSTKCVLLRLFFWQMIIDADILSKNLSLVDVDNIIACEPYLLIENPHHPFEQIQFWQFIHILIILSWHLYGQFVSSEPLLVQDDKVTTFLNCYEKFVCKNALKSAFVYFIENDLFRGRLRDFTPRRQENRFKENDLAPMEAMYLIYRSVGEPHSARDFVKALCCKVEEGEDEGKPSIVRYFEKLPYYKIEGKNALTVAGELQHLPEQKPFNRPEIVQLEKDKVKANPKSELSCFNGLKPKQVVRCLIEVCPGIAIDEFIANMDYQLTFLEFYKALVLSTKLQLKMRVMDELRDTIVADYLMQMEEYKRKMSEYEKQRENAVVSRKKSRQLSEMSKKGRK